MIKFTIDDLKKFRIFPSDIDDYCELYEFSLEYFDLRFPDYILIRDLTSFFGPKNIELHFILLAMFFTNYSGSVCMELEYFEIKCFFENFSEVLIKKYFNDFETNISKNVYNKIIGSENEYKPIILSSDKKKLYFHKYYHSENKLEEYIKQKLSMPRNNKLYNDKIFSFWLDEIFEKNVAIVNKKKIELDCFQKIAVILGCIENFLIVSGGPGTGKTSIVVNLLRMFIRKNYLIEKIKIAAPTGRAVKRIYESIEHSILQLEKKEFDLCILDIECLTLHSLLKYNPVTRNFSNNKYNQLDLDVIIVDEVSMADTILLSNLFESIKPSTKIILLGDKNQLPSVDAGAVLTDILPEKLELSFSYEFTEFYSKKYNKYDLEFGSKKKNIFTDHIVFLKKSFRSQKKILEIAELINLQKSEVLNYFSKINMENFSDNFTGIYFIRDDEIKLYDLLDKWFEKNFLFKVVKSYKFIDLISKKYDFEKYDDINLLFYLFEFYFSSIVLGLVKNGINGTINMNRYFTAKLGDLQNVSYDFFPGLPIMITQNDYKNNLFNGEIGILVLDKFSELRAIFRNGDRILNFSLNDLNSFEIAFSVTVHKSQGSEYENVLLILPEKDSRILSKEIIYTGITRAKIMVLMYGKTEIFNECLNRKINRKSGFFKIKKNID